MANTLKQFVEIGDHVWQYDSGEDGPNAMVFGGIHGNELAGIETVKRIRSGEFELALIAGKLTVALGNLLAIEQGTRATDDRANLNREFLVIPTEEERARQDASEFYETERGQELMPHLLEADAVLDLHGFRQHDGIDFFITAMRGFKIARAIARATGTSIISSGWDTIERGGTDSAMEEQGKIGICYELGQLYDLENGIPRAETGVINFLHMLQLVAINHPLVYDEPRYVHAEQAVLAEGDFEWGPEKQDLPFRSWQQLDSGVLIARNGGQEIRAKKGQRIIFPSDDLHPKAGSEVFNLGTEFDPFKK